MADLAELMAMNEVSANTFRWDPRRHDVQAAGLVAGARVEIKAIACLMKRRR
jgi:enamine deaminase RidA (YjgF/YER057c/UK114 family)